jgi:hypothetical protein
MHVVFNTDIALRGRFAPRWLREASLPHVLPARKTDILRGPVLGIWLQPLAVSSSFLDFSEEVPTTIHQSFRKAPSFHFVDNK